MLEDRKRDQGAWTEKDETSSEEEPEILEEVRIEEITVDGICGVY